MGIGPMRAVTDPEVHTVTCMGPTQEFKTELILNTVGYFGHQDPAPILLVLPTDKLAESFSKDRLEPMLRDTPVLRAISADPKSRDSKNTLTRKTLEGGSVIDLVGANSPTDLSSRPKRVVLADEIDKYPESAGKEGDPLSLAEERQSSFWNRFSIRTCSPTDKDFSAIGREYELSDQRRAFVHCPHCGDPQVMLWPNVKWDKDEDGNHIPETAQYQCRGCGVLWTEQERVAAIMAMVDAPGAGYCQTKPFRCCGKEHKPLSWHSDEHWDDRGMAHCPECGKRAPFAGHAGFNVSKLYSTRQGLADTVRKFLLAVDYPEKLKVFINTQLAELWEEQSVKISPEGLMARCEAYDDQTIPDDVLILTAGVDTQDDRLEVEIVGWGPGRENWGVHYRVLYGDPSQDAVWRELDAVLTRDYRTVSGKPLRVAATCIDSGGHHADPVCRFAKARAGRKVWAIKANGQPGRPIWPKRASKTKSFHNVFVIGSIAATEQVYGDLKVKDAGAGYCHFPQTYDETWFDQVIADKPKTKVVGNRRVRVFETPPGRRNEALDCRKYALAALISLNVLLPAPRPRPVPAAERPAKIANDTAPQPAKAEAPRSAPALAPAPMPVAEAAPAPKRKPRGRRKRLHDGDRWI